MELDLGPDGLFYSRLADVDVSTVHENRRITASGTWRRVPEGEDEAVETEGWLSVTLEVLPPDDVTDPEDLLSLPWEEYQVEED